MRRARTAFSRVVPALVLCLVALTAVVPATAQEISPDDAQLVITAAWPDREEGLLVVSGLGFGADEPELTFGLTSLDVLVHSDTRVEAALPPGLPVGSYLLIVARGERVHEYDVFSVAMPPLPSPSASSPEGERTAEIESAVRASGTPGPVGPMGPRGPEGPAGPPGVSGLESLAGRSCPDGTFVVGFAPDGGLDCRAASVVASLADPLDAEPSPGVTPRANDGSSPVAQPDATRCLGEDAAWSRRDLPAREASRTPVLGEYPEAATGELHGRLAFADRDAMSLAVSERRGRFCLGNRFEDPLRAELELELEGDGAGALLCACWSSAEATCGLVRTECVEVMTARPGTLELVLPTVCGQHDHGYLDVEILRIDGEPGVCPQWTLRWRVSEE